MNEDKATRYNRLKRRVTVVSLIATVGLLVALLATGWSLALRDAARSNVLAYVALFSIVNEAVGLPLAFYGGFLLERDVRALAARPGEVVRDRTRARRRRRLVDLLVHPLFA